MTVSKPLLLAILGVGMLLGIGIAFLVTGNLESPSSESEPSAKSARSDKKKQKKGAGGDPVAPLSPEEAASLLGDYLDRGESEEDLEQLKRLVVKAAEWSPESTMEQVMLIEDPYQRRDTLKRLFTYWIGSDRKAALEAIKAIENVALQRDLYREAMSWLSRDDPRSAIKLLKDDGNFHDHDLWARAFATWSRTDREGAVRSALAIEHSERRQHVLRFVAQQLADKDLAEALEWTGTLQGESQEAAMAGVLAEAANSNPLTVVEHLDDLPEGRVKDEIIRRTADEWAERDPGAAITWAETLDERARERAIGEIAETVLETDPDRAQEIADLIPGTEQRKGLLGQIARLRASVNVADAIGWLDRLPGEDRAGAWSGVAREWARIDPRAAAEFASESDDSVAQEQLVAAVSYSWSQRAPVEAAEWARSLEAGRTQANAMNRIFENWARADPAAAGDFATSYLDGELQANVTRQVVGRWLREDTAQASAWIDSLPDGRSRDSAVDTLIGSIEREFPETALQWANTIGDEKKREYVERRLRRRLGE